MTNKPMPDQQTEIEALREEVRSKTLEEVRALIVAAPMEATEYVPCGEGTCGSDEPVGYTLNQLNAILDLAKKSAPLWVHSAAPNDRQEKTK